MEIGLRDLLEAGVHFGHQTRRWNPKMKRYIFMERNGIYILDLQKTMHALEAARKAIDTAVRGGGKVLFVGTKRQAKDPLIRESERCGMFHITERWLGGMLTNFKTVRSSVKRLLEIEAMATDGTYERLAKKEVVKLEKQRVKLEKVFSGHQAHGDGSGAGLDRRHQGRADRGQRGQSHRGPDRRHRGHQLRSRSDPASRSRGTTMPCARSSSMRAS